jgi:hypothetical protein
MVQKNLDDKIKMISAVSRALELRKLNSDNEKILGEISSFASSEKNPEVKLGMIAAASKALEIADQDSRLKEKDVIKKVMASLSTIKRTIDSNQEI